RVLSASGGVAGGVQGNAIEPGRKSAGLAVAASVLVDAEENFLAEIGGPTRVPGQPIEEATDRPLPAAHEGLEGANVALPPPRHQIGIVQTHGLPTGLRK